MDRIFFIFGSVLGALSVALSTFSTHAVHGRGVESLLANYQTGVAYMFFHALALFVVVLAVDALAAVEPARHRRLALRRRDRLLLRQPLPHGLHGHPLAGRRHPHRRGRVHCGVGVVGVDSVAGKLTGELTGNG